MTVQMMLEMMVLIMTYTQQKRSPASASGASFSLFIRLRTFSGLKIILEMHPIQPKPRRHNINAEKANKNKKQQNNYKNITGRPKTSV